MKSVYNVNNKNIIEFNYDVDNVRLQRYEIYVDFHYFIQIFNVHHYFILEIVKNIALNNEDRKVENRRLRRSNHFVVDVHFVENDVNYFTFFKFNRVNFNRFHIDIEFQIN